MDIKYNICFIHLILFFLKCKFHKKYGRKHLEFEVVFIRSISNCKGGMIVMFTWMNKRFL